MTKVSDYFDIRKRNGEVGIEIEIEGDLLPDHIDEYWRVVEDGSLRGEEAWEYVLIDPVAREDTKKVLTYWKERMDKFGAKVNRESNRTSVHVHINMQDKNFKEVVNFAVLYYIMEDLLVKYCGESREGNLFCLRTRDAEFIIEGIEQAIMSSEWYNITNNNIRYAALNFASLAKYGSLEFRALRGTDDVEYIETWINMLLRLKDHSLQYNNPADIVSNFSMIGGERWLKEVMGDKFFELLSCDDMDYILHKGVRRIQDIAFAYQRKDINKKKNVKKKGRVVHPPPRRPGRPGNNWDAGIQAGRMRNFVVNLPEDINPEEQINDIRIQPGDINAFFVNLDNDEDLF